MYITIAIIAYLSRTILSTECTNKHENNNKQSEGDRNKIYENIVNSMQTEKLRENLR